MNEISPDELLCLPKDSYVLVDIRDEGLRLYGMIPGAVSVSYEELLCGSCKRLAVIPKEKKGQSFFLWDWPCHTIGC